MKDGIYLICNDYEVVGIRKNRPNLKGGEIAILLDIAIPDTYFRQYGPTAYITLNEPVPTVVNIKYEPD